MSDQLIVDADIRHLFFKCLGQIRRLPVDRQGRINYPEPMTVLTLLQGAGATTLQKRVALVAIYNRAVPEAKRMKSVEVDCEAGNLAWPMVVSLNDHLDFLLKDRKPLSLLHRICRVLELGCFGPAQVVLMAICVQLARQASFSIAVSEAKARDDLLRTVAESMAKVISDQSVASLIVQAVESLLIPAPIGRIL